MTITSLPSGSFFLENIPDIDILTAKTRLLVTINFILSILSLHQKR